MIKRKFTQTLKDRFKSHCEKIQVILGPRQVGKTTGVRQFRKKFPKAKFLWVTMDNFQEFESNPRSFLDSVL